MPKNDDRIRFLDMVIPLLMVYTATSALHLYFKSGPSENEFWDVVILSICSFFAVYGALALRRDVHKYGIKNILKELF